MEKVLRPFNTPRDVNDVSECFWYHDMDLPEIGRIEGACDMSNGYKYTIEAIPLNGKTVLEIGPASGAYTFAMEAKGASVTSVELSPKDTWDYVPHAGREPDNENLGAHLEALQNSYWFGHKRTRSKAQVYPASVYDLEELGMFDVGTIHAVLVHLRDPLLAMERVAEHTRETLVITDVEPFAERRSMTLVRLAVRNMRLMSFIPRADDMQNNHTWWHLSPGLVAEHARILGFRHVKIDYFSSRFLKRSLPVFCVTARRSLH